MFMFRDHAACALARAINIQCYAGLKIDRERQRKNNNSTTSQRKWIDGILLAILSSFSYILTMMLTSGHCLLVLSML